MARYIGSLCRLCRRENVKLFLKGARCSTEKCAVVKRPTIPGQHGGKRGAKLSNYGLQLREKQKVKRMYGILERQFRKYFNMATKVKGVTGRQLLQYLERRLDNCIFRMNFSVSRNQARQIVRHNHVLVNSKKVNIPSYMVKVNDVITLKGKDKFLNLIRDNIEICKSRQESSWIEVNQKDLTAKVIRLPEKEDIAIQIQEQLIVELYSK